MTFIQIIKGGRVGYTRADLADCAVRGILTVVVHAPHESFPNDRRSRQVAGLAVITQATYELLGGRLP